MNTAQKIANLEKQRAAQVAKLQALQIELDEAADAADSTLVSQLQSEINATAPMIASFDRRLEKARAEDTEAVRQARREANLKNVETFTRELAKQRKLAAPLAATVAQLAEQLEAVRASGSIARDAVAELVRQVPFGERPHHWMTALHASDMQTTLGAILEDLLQKHGIFQTLAPNSGISLRHHGFPTIDEVFTTSGNKLHSMIQGIAEKINEGI